MAKFFVSGIDTNIGKTVAVGYLAREFMKKGDCVITQKLVQTGCAGVSEDILRHREIMRVPLFDEDKDFTTCRYVAKFPASPHLAFTMENRTVDYSQTAKDSDFLEKKFGTVIVEGAGGLLVPLEDNFTTADYILKNSLPLILVVSSRLGSLNHALLSLEYCRFKGINLYAVLYNTYPSAPKEIECSTKDYLLGYISKNFSSAKFLEMGKV